MNVNRTALLKNAVSNARKNIGRFNQQVTLSKKYGERCHSILELSPLETIISPLDIHSMRKMMPLSLVMIAVNTMTPLLSTKCVVGGVKKDKVGERRNYTGENTAICDRVRHSRQTMTMAAIPLRFDSKNKSSSKIYNHFKIHPPENSLIQRTTL